jgi:hypothetical protein
MTQVADDSTPKKSAVIRLVGQDVLETRRRTRTVAASGVVKFAVRVDPKYELRDAVGKVTNRSASASVVWRKEIEPLSGLISGNATNCDHGRRMTISDLSERSSAPSDERGGASNTE